MKKTLIAVALAAALPAVAFAQTNVTLYGIADGGVGWNDTDGAGDSATMVVNSGYNSSSRFGLRGTEDLGSGLKATFNFEAGLDVDTGTSDSDIGSTFWGRRAVVGLAGGFGEIRFGRDYTSGFSAIAATDIMSFGLFGNWGVYTVGAGGILTRASNGIHYTGTFSGITLRAMYAEGEVLDTATTDSSGGDVYGISAVYKGGPLTLQASFQEVNNALGDAVQQIGVGAGYEFGGFRVTLNYGMGDADTGAVVRGGVNAQDEVQALGLGVGMKLGTGQLLAQAIQIEGDLVGGGKAKGTSFGLAYLHPLSKRTNLYATFGMVNNNGNSNYAQLSADNAIAAGGLGADPKGVAIGVRHLF